MNTAVTDRDEIRNHADKIFDALLDVWEDGLKTPDSGWLHADYWKGGNTLDSAINYFAVADPARAGKYAASLIQKSYDLYEARFDKGPWRDDYGWWGNAFANVVRNQEKLGDLPAELVRKCRTAARACWQVLAGSAAENQQYGAGLPGVMQVVGARYTPWNEHSARTYFETTDSRYTFRPVPNTVTSSNFLSLSLALVELEPANAAYPHAIFSCVCEWMYLLGISYKPPAAQAGRGNLLFNDSLMVRETPNPWEHRNWCYDLDRAWSADQGVCLYVLSRIAKRADAQAGKCAQEILNVLLQGYVRYETAGKLCRSVNGLIVDDTFREFETATIPDREDDNLSNFNNNYCTGPGVFMRYLAYAFPDLSDELKSTFRGVIAECIAQAWQNRDPETSMIGYWYGRFEDSPYRPYYNKFNPNDPDNHLWKLAPQVAALDLFVAGLKIGLK